MNFYDMLFLPFILESACYHFTLEIFHTFFDVPNLRNNEFFFLSLISELKTVVEGKVRAFLKKYRPESYDILMSLKHLR